MIKPINISNQYRYLLNVYENRKKHISYRSLAGTFFGSNGFCIRENADGQLEVGNYWNEKYRRWMAKEHAQGRRLKDVIPDQLPPVAVFLDQHTVQIHPGNWDNSHTTLSRLVSWISNGCYWLKKNRRLATDADFFLMPDTRWARADGKYYMRLLDTKDTFQNLEPLIEQFKVPVKGGFQMESGEGPNVIKITSNVPVRHRHWVAGKRSEYLRHVRELRDQTVIRARVGAFDDFAFNLHHRWKNERWQNVRDRRSEIADEIAKLQLDDHKTYKDIVEMGQSLRGYWHLSPSSEIENDSLKAIEKLKEPLRQGLGAVVYL